MRYLPLIVALFFAVPAWGACPSTIWPACTVKFSTGERLEDRWGQHTIYTESTIPTCDSDVPGLTIYISNATDSTDCASGTAGTVTAQCACDGVDTWEAMSGGGGSFDNPVFTGIVTLPVNDNSTVSSEGEIAVDRDFWGLGYDAIEFFNGTDVAQLVATKGVPTNRDIPVFRHVTGPPETFAIVWEERATLESNDFTSNQSGVIGGKEYWDIGVNGQAEFAGYVRADTFGTCTLTGSPPSCNPYIRFGDGSEEYFWFWSDAGDVILDSAVDMLELADYEPLWGAGYGAYWVKNTNPPTPWFTEGDGDTKHELLRATGGIMIGDLVFNDNINATFGTDLDATISHNDTNLLIDNGTGYTDLTGALWASQDEDVVSRFGLTPISLSGSDSADVLVTRKARTASTTGNKRGLIAVAEVDGNLALANSAGNYGANTFAYTVEGRTVSSNKTTNGGALVGNRAAARHEADGTIAMAGGISTNVTIQGANKDGIITDGYGLLVEGGDGGGEAGEISTHRGVWIKDSTGNVVDNIGIHIEAISGTNSGVGFQIDGAQDIALWVAAGQDATTAKDGIFFGQLADVNLHRDAPNVLRTDDSFIVGGAQLKVQTNQLMAGAAKINFNDTDIGIYAHTDVLANTYLDIFADMGIRIGNSSGGAPTTYLTIDPDANTYWVGDSSGIPYGSMYNHDTPTVVDIVAMNTPTEIPSGFSQGQVNLTTFQNAKEIVVDKAGRYAVTWQISFSTASGVQEIEGCVMVGGTCGLTITAHRKIGNAADTGSMSATGILDLAASDVISLAVTNESSSTVDVNIEHANMTVTMVGGT